MDSGFRHPPDDSVFVATKRSESLEEPVIQTNPAKSVTRYTLALMKLRNPERSKMLVANGLEQRHYKMHGLNLKTFQPLDATESL